MYSANNEGKSVVAGSLRTLKRKIYKKITANDTKSYLSYLNRLVDDYSFSYHRSVNKKAIDADYSAFPEEFESSHKVPKFKVADKVGITKYKNIFSKSNAEKWTKERFVIDSVLKINPWIYNIKERIRGSSYKNAFQVKVVSYWSNYATKKN